MSAGLTSEDVMNQIRQKMDDVLVGLRDLRSRKNPGEKGGRELSEAITCFETGCMWMIRSEFADKGEYTPLLRLKPATE